MIRHLHFVPMLFAATFTVAASLAGAARAAEPDSSAPPRPPRPRASAPT